MNKKRLSALFIVFILLLSVGLTSCKKDNTSIYGVWSMKTGGALNEGDVKNFEGIDFVISEKDNSLRYELSDPDNASTDAARLIALVESLSLTLEDLTDKSFVMVSEVDGNSSRDEITYTIKDNEMIWLDKGGGEMHFVRKK